MLGAGAKRDPVSILTGDSRHFQHRFGPGPITSSSCAHHPFSIAGPIIVGARGFARGDGDDHPTRHRTNWRRDAGSASDGASDQIAAKDADPSALALIGIDSICRSAGSRVDLRT
jgi:hypothetical protein